MSKYLFILLVFFTCTSNAQDTTLQGNLNEIVITSYFRPENQFFQTASAISIDSLRLKQPGEQTLLPAANEISGVRMEERSPGSYRFSIRGSLLRSPFGIRNVKFYLNEFALTDAGGNTYLNLFDQNFFTGVEILKGPDGSIFGANSGGVVRLQHTPLKDSSKVSIEISAGSYGDLYQSVNSGIVKGKHHLTIFESYRKNDGYRENSNLKRFNAGVYDRFNANEKLSFDAFLFYADLSYRTPGGLTKSQMEKDPKQSRPATTTTPSAIQQKAGIENKSMAGGLQLKYSINSKISYLFCVNALYTDFKNPFITNFEKRIEKNGSARSWFLFENKNTSFVQYKIVAGAEAGELKTEIKNSVNESGIATNLLSADNIVNDYLFSFASASVYFGSKISVQVSSSYNLNSISIENNYPDIAIQKVNYGDQTMPRFSAIYSPTKFVVLRGVISKGYSVPTTAEIRPSGNMINTSLQPENGWNKEIGIRLKTKSNFFKTDISLFEYNLRNAIARRTTEDDEEYFINAGETDQRGIEIQNSFHTAINRNKNLNLLLTNGITLNDFKFTEFISSDGDLSGKKIAGVPDQTISTAIEFVKSSNWSIRISHYYSGILFLNDANTASTKSYNLFDFTAQKIFVKNGFKLTVFGKAENLTNTSYSAGHDLNSFGGRYYNPSPARMFSGGLLLNI